MTASITAPSRVRHLHRPRRRPLPAGALQVPAQGCRRLRREEQLRKEKESIIVGLQAQI